MLRAASKDYLTGLYKINQRKREYFTCTASYGNLYIDSVHGMFCISRRSKNSMPMDFGDLYAIEELTEAALYCTNIRNIGTRYNQIVCDVKMRIRTKAGCVEYLIRSKEHCTYRRSMHDSRVLECDEPATLVMFRRIFNQMIENVRSGILRKLEEIQQAKAAIRELDKKTEWAKGVLMLDDDYTLEAAKRNRNILIKTFHPDVFGEKGTAFAEKINRAYNIIAG